MQLTAVILFSVLPWLNPFSMGPAPGAVPFLFSWACVAMLIGTCAIPVLPARWAGSIATAWLVAALLSVAMGLLQYFGATAIFGQWVNSASAGEAFANLRQRNQFATLTNIGLAALLWWVAQARCAPALPHGAANVTRSFGASPVFMVSAVSLAVALLLAAGNAASASRTGLLQLTVLVAMAWAWSLHRWAANSNNYGPRRSVRRVLLVSAIGYGIAALLLPRLAGFDPHVSGIMARLHAGDVQCSSRLTLWSNVLHLIAQKPWLGWGWGELDYAHFITLYSGPRFCGILDNAHSLPLHLAVELGVPFALVFCALCLWLALRAKPWRETDATRQMAWTVLALIGLHSLLEYPLWYGPFQMAVGLSIYLLWRTPAAIGSGAPSSGLPAPETEAAIGFYGGGEPLARRFIAVAATFFLAGLAYAAWDYHRISQIYLPPASRAAAYRDDTLVKIQGSWLFKNQVRFAELTTTPLSQDNALHTFEVAKDLLHFSPEARVVDKLIESAALLGRDDEAQFYQARFNAAFPRTPR